ncbi:hypothetical protein F1B92_05700 [Campylobacter sp. FMV-PI01]|uniref:Bacterial virulence protein VirB8 domain-containing protein n=1 Tax=Campylobacter portucalensis TaxID=2608384 RepID=A0A6L5WHF7_9BACT|nr:VirB8/TrbF family protein [Campylobacter portucalensis]MSN96658.1 hypothetical protein [Campylobacter portucalensis]
MVEKSNKRAWLIAFLYIAISIISMIAALLLTPLKNLVFYVVRVKYYTARISSINESSLLL